MIEFGNIVIKYSSVVRLVVNSGKMKLFMVLQILVLFELHDGNTLPKLQTIPEAPRLAELNYNRLPEFIKKYLPAEISNARIAPNIGRKETAPRTYGMKLNNDQGVVWNDLVSPKMSYHVGNNENTALDDQKDIDDIIEDMINKIDSRGPPEATTNKISVIKTEFVSTTPAPESKNHFGTTELPKSTVIPEKQISEKELLKEIGNKLDKIIKDGSKYIRIAHNKTKSNEIKDKSEVADKGDNGIEDDKSDIKKGLAKNVITGKTGDQENPPIPSLLEQIIQNDDLWQWLSNNIAKYLEILVARIGGFIQEEVEVLIQEYFESHQCGCGTNSSRFETNGKGVKKPDLGRKEDTQKDDSVDKNDINGKYDNNSNVDKKDELQENIINVDKEIIDIGSNNDTVDIYKHNKDKNPEQIKHDNHEKEITYRKTTIYGDCIENEKITNVFIFNMNSDGTPLLTIHNSSSSNTMDVDKNFTSTDDKYKDNDQIITESMIDKENNYTNYIEETTEGIATAIDGDMSKETTEFTSEESNDEKDANNKIESNEELENEAENDGEDSFSV